MFRHSTLLLLLVLLLGILFTVRADDHEADDTKDDGSGDSHDHGDDHDHGDGDSGATGLEMAFSVALFLGTTALLY